MLDEQLLLLLWLCIPALLSFHLQYIQVQVYLQVSYSRGHDHSVITERRQKNQVRYECGMMKKQIIYRSDRYDYSSIILYDYSRRGDHLSINLQATHALLLRRPDLASTLPCARPNIIEKIYKPVHSDKKPAACMYKYVVRVLIRSNQPLKYLVDVLRVHVFCSAEEPCLHLWLCL